jgi:hypothetical protein
VEPVVFTFEPRRIAIAEPDQRSLVARCARIVGFAHRDPWPAGEARRYANNGVMTVRQVVWFIAAYIAIVALAMWFNLAVLCQGDVKFNRGCGGFSLYIPLWETFLAPLPIAAILLELWRKATPPPTTRLLAYLTAILVITEIGFLLIERFPVLLATEAAAIGIACLLRWKAVGRRSSPNRY